VKCQKINGEAFMEYIQSMGREDCDNLDSWSVSELEHAIEGYRDAGTMQLIVNPEIDS
jgi:hypothetical protein